jgi:hypothetical protein
MGLGWKRNGCLSTPSANMRAITSQSAPDVTITAKTLWTALRQTRRDDYAVKTCAGTSLPCFVGGVAVRLTGVAFDYWC